MRRLLIVFLAVLLFAAGLTTGCGESDSGGNRKAALEAKARKVVESIAASDYGAASADFDATMKSQLPPPALKQAWETLTSKGGSFKQITGVRTEKSGGYEMVFITCALEKTPIDVKVVFNKDGKVTGLFFVPVTTSAAYNPPAYVRRDSFEEQEVTVKTGEYSLPGTISMPNGEGPFPGLVLVHGSGPNDRDESVGGSKTFRDLAWGLASRGIAVLRYEKRTKEYQSRLAQPPDGFTVQQETVDDALSAVALMEDTEKVDPKKVFVLGHSLGGMLIPRIAEQGKDIHGFIVMAGAARPLEDLLLEQVTYIANLDRVVSAEESAQIEGVRAAAALVKSPDLRMDTPAGSLPLGAPGSYWLDLRGYDPAQAAKSITRPVLILQGERDYNVTMEDLGRWNAALGLNKNVTFETYPTLNHLFIEGKGKSTPDEYQKTGHVPVFVIDDISGFIRKN